MGIDAKYRPLVGAFAALLTLSPALAAAAGASGCRLALAHALDVSSSVDETEYRLQKTGLAAALQSPEVRAALLDDRAGWVALAVYEWSGRYQQALLVDWTAIRSDADIGAVAARIAAGQRSHADFPTAIGYALGYGAGLLDRAPDCARLTLDMSGDGINNEGFAPDRAYAHFPFYGVTVNGLVIEGADPDVLPYYQREIRRGPGAFVQVAGGYADYENAIRLKLLREISVRVIGAADAAQ